MRIYELLLEGQVPELELIPNTGELKVVMFKGRKLTITTDWYSKEEKFSMRPPDFSVGAWNFSQDGGAQCPCWVTGPNSAVCDLGVYPLRPTVAKPRRPR